MRANRSGVMIGRCAGGTVGVPARGRMLDEQAPGLRLISERHLSHSRHTARSSSTDTTSVQKAAVAATYLSGRYALLRCIPVVHRPQ
jgi:hypothetical protein